ncbi:MAG TPA: HEAT repeat domain-containing protein [Pirellulaceae bacterium]|jgi:hypothetical protein|nr:HEAT repeat domain-containing protein [Pirellulaceae bacterium]
MDPALEELMRRYSELDARRDAEATLAVQRALLDVDDDTAARRLRELADEIENSRVAAVIETAIERALATRESPHALRLWHLGAREGEAPGSLWRDAYARSLAAQPLRGHVLRLASRVRDEAALDLVVDLLANDPPAQPEQVDAALAEWFALPAKTLRTFVPRLTPALAHPACVAGVLDVMNWCIRAGHLDRHPASDRETILAQSLTAVVARLQEFAGSAVEEADAAARAREIERAVSLCVALIDALGWMKSERGRDALGEALLLPHRRIQTEAAAALARRGDPRGAERLAELALDPASRLRAKKYARELGLEERLPPQARGEIANYEAELAAWLAHPRAMGMAPTRMEFVARRKLPWAAAEQPVDYVLFRVEYRLGTAWYENLAFAGPTPFATSSDLMRLSIYDACALVMGTHAEHDSIRRWNVDPAELSRWTGALDRLAEEGLSLESPDFVADFFEERCLIGEFLKEGQRGRAVLVRGETEVGYWLPLDDAPRPLTPEETFAIWQGRKFFVAFGFPEGAEESQERE